MNSTEKFKEIWINDRFENIKKIIFPDISVEKKETPCLTKEEMLKINETLHDIIINLFKRVEEIEKKLEER